MERRALPLLTRLVERIRREGPIRFDEYVEAALYDPDGGFFSTAGGAGRAGADFVTSPEVGPLFGALVARAIDGWWEQLGRPDPFVVVDAGAGRGQLARDVLRAGPACAPALRYVMVERSALLRERQLEYLRVEPAAHVLGPAVRSSPDDEPEPVPGLGPIVTQLPDLPAEPLTGVVIANELLDNLAFRVVERAETGWLEVRVGADAGGRLVEVPVPTELGWGGELGPVPVGARVPVQTGVSEWLHACRRMVRRGFVVVIDYADEAASVARRGEASWLRTYRGHERGGPPLEGPGTQDITCDVVLEHLRASARREGFDVVEETSQAEWLGALGIADLVEEARATWRHRAHLGDLEAVKARSRVGEAEALLDPSGLGGHRVVVLARHAR